jgi:DNA-binding NarL/FixJ family response regulator
LTDDTGGVIRVVIADDHTLFRQGIRELLSTDENFEVVGEGATGADAVQLVREHHPDVILLDVEMPGPGPTATVKWLHRAAPNTRIVVLTMHDDPALVHDLLESGASAYLVKTIVREELMAAVRSVSRTESHVLLSVSRETIEGLDRQRPESGLLSVREMDVLGLVAQALSNGQIATRLFITEGTVKRHLTNIYTKLGAVSRVDAVRKATAAGLLPPA